MKAPSLPTRLKAAGIHLAVSALIGGSALFLIYTLWFPQALSVLMGVERVTFLLILVDVVLGPLLTLVIFDPAKGRKVLRRDLSMIGCAQFTALVLGLSTIEAGRPLFLVFSVDSFTAVTEQELDVASWERASSNDAARASMLGPTWVAAEMPPPGPARNKLLFSALGGGPDLPQSPEHFRPYAQLADRIIEKMQPISALAPLNPQLDIDWQARFGLPANALGHLPVVAMPNEASVILRRSDAAPLGILNLRPAWPASQPAAD